MPPQAKPLTQADVESAKTRGHYADGGGLYLRVGPTGAKSYVFRYRAEGRMHDLGLGRAQGKEGDRGLSLHEARLVARECRDDLERFREFVAGRYRLRPGEPVPAHPAELREQAKAQARAARVVEAVAAVPSFRAVAEDYIDRQAWKNVKHAQQWRATLATYAYRALGDVPVDRIDTKLVLRAIEPIWNSKPETANRVRGRIEAVLNAAKVKGLREGDNPARWKGHLAGLLPASSKVKTMVRERSGRAAHHAALPYRDLPEFIAALREQPGTSAQALRFAILTCARTGEVRGARWREVDLEERVWTVPPARMKGGKEHRVPLTVAALACLGERGADDALVFPGPRGGPMSNMAMLMLLRRMGRGNLTVHGFRSTFADWAVEKTMAQHEVREMALAHAVGDKVEAAYRRGDLFDKRRELADTWAKFAVGEAGEVVQFPRAG